MAPATCLSQALVFVCAAPFASTAEVGPKDLALLAGLGVGQIGLGLIFLTIGARLIPAAEVALITLLEIVLGPLWVWIVLGEQPSATTLAGGAIVLAAVVIQAAGAAGRAVGAAAVGGRGIALAAVPAASRYFADPLSEKEVLPRFLASCRRASPSVTSARPSCRASWASLVLSCPHPTPRAVGQKKRAARRPPCKLRSRPSLRPRRPVRAVAFRSPDHRASPRRGLSADNKKRGRRPAPLPVPSVREPQVSRRPRRIEALRVFRGCTRRMGRARFVASLSGRVVWLIHHPSTVDCLGSLRSARAAPAVAAQRAARRPRQQRQ